MYPILVVPIPANLTCCVDGALNSAVRMWVFGIGGEVSAVFPPLLSLSVESTNDRWVLILTHFDLYRFVGESVAEEGRHR